MKKDTRIVFCKVCGTIVKKYKKQELCDKHFFQWYKHGKFFDNNPRTVWDPNEIRTNNEYAEIDTYDQYGNVLVTYKLDLEDMQYLGNNKWRTVFKGKDKNIPYLVTGHTIYFHRLIMGDPNKEIDHINRDSRDNRKQNLRESCRTQQLTNTRLRSNNTLGIKGIYYSKRDNDYHAEISINKKRYFSKHYKTKAEAAYFRYLLEQKFYSKLGIYNNTQEMLNLINSLTDEQKSDIQTCFANRAKAWV